MKHNAPASDPSSPDHYRSIFLSDIHLGTKNCQAEILLDFLKHNECDYLYLVGDIVDGWQLKQNWYWPQPHNDVVQKILRKSRKGTKVIFIPGNHDEAFRDYTGTHFGGIKVKKTAIHKGADGKKYLVLHGDEFDNVMLYARWLAFLGDFSYDKVIRLNSIVNFFRRKLGLHYWSLSAYLKLKVKNAVQFISTFEETVAREARKNKVDGVICGHIHHAEMRDIDGIHYKNDGDWVESCTALVEHEDGRWEILPWADIMSERSKTDTAKHQEKINQAIHKAAAE